jgi:methionyl-tRNA formyltransferase
MVKKIILFGCQAISIDVLRFLHSQRGVEISKVITYEVPSDLSLGQESIKTVASDLGIEAISPCVITMELINEIRDLKPDLIISAYYRKIFCKELIDIPRLGIINIHPSLLPNYRGRTPTAWAILNNEKKFGVTIHKVDEGIDTGDILVQATNDIDDDETGYELHLKAMSLGAKLLIKNFSNIVNERIDPIKQPIGGTYYGKLKLQDFLDWQQSAQMIKNNVRVRARPYKPIETILENKRFSINKVSLEEGHNHLIEIPGKILKVNNDDSLVVSCSDGAVHIQEYSVNPPFTGVEKESFLQPGRVFHV